MNRLKVSGLVLTSFAILANLADYITTVIGLSFSNIYEINLFMASIIEQSFLLFSVVKVGVISLIFFGALAVHEYCKMWRNRLIIKSMLFVLGVIFTVVAIHNVNIILSVV